jgi:hypothetical protein
MAQDNISIPTTQTQGSGLAQVLTPVTIAPTDFTKLMGPLQKRLQETKQTREKNELIKRQYDAKVADTGGLKFNQTKEARDVMLDKMSTELSEAGTQAEKEAIYNKFIPELNLIKQEDILYQRRIEAIGEDDRNTLFSNTEDGTVIGVMDIVDKLNSPLTEKQRASLIADGAGQFVTGLDSYHNNMFKYGGTPEAVGLDEVGAVLKAMQINQTIPVETDTEGKIDVYKTFEKLDADQRAIVENALLNPNSAFSQSYRNDQAIRQGTINIPTTLDETTGFDIYGGQRDLLNNIIQSQMGIDTKIYKETGTTDKDAGGVGIDANAGTISGYSITPTSQIDINGEVISMPMLIGKSTQTVEDDEGNKYSVSGFAFDKVNDQRYAVDQQGRILALGNPELSQNLAIQWENATNQGMAANKQPAFQDVVSRVKDIEGTRLATDKNKEKAFEDAVRGFGKGIDTESSLLNYLSDLQGVGLTPAEIEKETMFGGKTFKQQFRGVYDLDIDSDEAYKIIREWALENAGPTLFLQEGDAFKSTQSNIDNYMKALSAGEPTDVTEEENVTKESTGGNSLELDVFPTPKNTNSAAPAPAPAPKEKVVADEKAVTEKTENQPSIERRSQLNEFVTNTAQKIFDYEGTSGSASGQGLKDFGFTDDKYKEAKYDKYREGGKSGAPLTQEGALQIFEEEYVSKVPSEYPEIIKEQLVDWKFNSGRSITDLLLVADGALTEETAAENKIFTEEWNREKARIERGMKENPEEWKAKIKEAKHKMYKLKSKNAYEKTWKNRIEIFD